jgi:hypothetical protein
MPICGPGICRDQPGARELGRTGDTAEEHVYGGNANMIDAPQRFACGHVDYPVKTVGDPPYVVPLPSNGQRLCPTCFLTDCHEAHFLEHEQRLNMGPVKGKGDVWFSLLLRQRKVLRYEQNLQNRIDLSEVAKQRVWTQFLASVRAISQQYDLHVWQAFLPSHEPAYQDMERAFIAALVDEQLSGAPVPWCDGSITLKCVDLAQIDEGSAERVPLRTLDEWRTASAQGPLVLVCHKTALRRYGKATKRHILPEERVAYLVEDPIMLHLLWQATFYEFRHEAMRDGHLTWVYAERPLYRIAQPRMLAEQSFLVKPSFSDFGLCWLFHLSHIVAMEPLKWVDDLWERGGIPEYLCDLADVHVNDPHTWQAFGKPEEKPVCFYCARLFDPQQSEVCTLGGLGVPNFCSGRCLTASRHVPYVQLYAQRVRNRQGKPLSPLGPVST